MNQLDMNQLRVFVLACFIVGCATFALCAKMNKALAVQINSTAWLSIKVTEEKPVKIHFTIKMNDPNGMVLERHTFPLYLEHFKKLRTPYSGYGFKLGDKWVMFDLEVEEGGFVNYLDFVETLGE